ncbi:MAG: hypothetical protein ABIG20_00215 [archaeon]
MMLSRCSKLLILAAVTLLFILPSATAIGIGPSRVILDFEPNYENTFSYTVVNGGDSILYAEIYVRGDLAEYVTLYDSTVKVMPKTSVQLSYLFKLPSDLPPGFHDTRIGVLESEENIGGEGSMLGGRAGVEQQLWVNVPYPGKYVSVALVAPSVTTGHPIDFTLNLKNYGTEDVTVTGSVELFDASNTSIATLPAGSVFLASQDAKALNAHWGGTKTAGMYKAIATITYEGESKQDEKIFHVGEVRVEIINVTIPPARTDSIAKINTEVESYWNEKIDGVYAEALLKSQTGTVFGSARSETLTLNPWTPTTLSAFWDTHGVEPGTYLVEVNVHYSGLTSTHSTTITLEEGMSLMMVMVIVMVIVVVVMLIIILLLLTRRRRGNDSR